MDLAELIKKHNDLSYEALNIKKEILCQITGWEAIANLGFFADAVTAYRNEHKCSFKEGITAINRYRRTGSLGGRS